MINRRPNYALHSQWAPNIPILLLDVVWAVSSDGESIGHVTTRNFYYPHAFS